MHGLAGPAVVEANAGWRLAAVAIVRMEPGPRGEKTWSAKNAAIASRPSYQDGVGGIVMRASSLRRAATAFGVALLERLHQPGQQRLLALTDGKPASQSASRFGSRCARVACARCSALLTEAARLERRRSLAPPTIRGVAQDQDGALPRREVLDRCQEGELGRLPGDQHGVGPGLAGRDVVEQPFGIGLEPRHVERRQRRRCRVGRSRHVGRQEAPLAAPRPSRQALVAMP